MLAAQAGTVDLMCGAAKWRRTETGKARPVWWARSSNCQK
jgi:hypothetical protein